jgi:hypothetical protein
MIRREIVIVVVIYLTYHGDHIGFDYENNVLSLNDK